MTWRFLSTSPKATEQGKFATKVPSKIVSDQDVPMEKLKDNSRTNIINIQANAHGKPSG